MVSKEEARKAVVEVLGEIAPEADAAILDENADLREELDLDSFDYLHFIVGISERLDIDVPESEYDKLTTLAGCEAYLVSSQHA